MPRLGAVKSSRAWIVYTVIRLGIFAIALAAFLLLQLWPWVAAVLAAVVSLCLSYIFFRGKRDELAKDIYVRRHSEQRDADNDLENEVLDRLENEKANPPE